MLFVVLFNNCTSSKKPNSTGTDTLAYNQDAMLMDLYLSDEIKPSPDYYDRIARDIYKIKNKYYEEYSDILRIGFRFPYVHNELLMAFDDTTTQKVKAGEYHDWDSLNAEYSLVELYDHTDFYELQFECCSHMYYLAPLYGKLPGVRYVNRNWTNEPNSNIYPKVKGDTLTYFYKHGWECSLAGGCANYEFLYIRSYRKIVEIVGYWNYKEHPNYPEWWDEAYQNVNDYWDTLWK